MLGAPVAYAYLLTSKLEPLNYSLAVYDSWIELYLNLRAPFLKDGASSHNGCLSYSGINPKAKPLVIPESIRVSWTVIYQWEVSHHEQSRLSKRAFLQLTRRTTASSDATIDESCGDYRFVIAIEVEAAHKF